MTKRGVYALVLTAALACSNGSKKSSSGGDGGSDPATAGGTCLTTGCPAAEGEYATYQSDDGSVQATLRYSAKAGGALPWRLAAEDSSEAGTPVAIDVALAEGPADVSVKTFVAGEDTSAADAAGEPYARIRTGEGTYAVSGDVHVIVNAACGSMTLGWTGTPATGAGVSGSEFLARKDCPAGGQDADAVGGGDATDCPGPEPSAICATACGLATEKHGCDLCKCLGACAGQELTWAPCVSTTCDPKGAQGDSAGYCACQEACP